MHNKPLHLHTTLETLSSAIAKLRNGGIAIGHVSDGVEAIRADEVVGAGWDDGSRFALRYAPNATGYPIRIGDWCLVEWDRKADKPVRLASGRELVVYRLF